MRVRVEPRTPEERLNLPALPAAHRCKEGSQWSRHAQRIEEGNRGENLIQEAWNACDRLRRGLRAIYQALSLAKAWANGNGESNLDRHQRVETSRRALRMFSGA
jgi:hypothetical protein